MRPGRAASSATSNRWVVAAAAVVMQAGLGSFYTWSVFREPLSDLYGTNVTSVNVAFFIAALVLGLAAFGGGLWMGRVDPRVVGVTGGVLYGLGVFLASFAGESLPLLYVTYGLLAGTGVGLAYVVPVATLPKWFPERPGLAYGIAVCGFGAGPGITVPIATALISATGGPLATFGVLGVAYFVLVVGAALFMKNPPEGHEPLERESSEAVASSASFSGALKTWQWYAMWVVLFLNASAGLAIISDASALASSIGGATAVLASAFVVVVAAGDTTGRLFWPALSDKIGPRGVFLTMFLLQAAAFVLLPLAPSRTAAFAVFCVLCFVVLTCYGGGYGVMPAFAGAYYGARNVGAIYGGMLTGAGVAGLGAPVLLAFSVDATGSYALALYATAGLMLLGAFVTLAIRPPNLFG